MEQNLKTKLNTYNNLVYNKDKISVGKYNIQQMPLWQLRNTRKHKVGSLE